MTLEEETERLNELLIGRQVERTARFKERELIIEFTDGTRLYVDLIGDKLDLSVVNVKA